MFHGARSPCQMTLAMEAERIEDKRFIRERPPQVDSNSSHGFVSARVIAGASSTQALRSFEITSSSAAVGKSPVTKSIANAAVLPSLNEPEHFGIPARFGG